MVTTTTPTDDLRGRREGLGISRLTLAVESGISPAWLAALEAGLRPHGGARTQVLAALDRLEANHEEVA